MPLSPEQARLQRLTSLAKANHIRATRAHVSGILREATSRRESLTRLAGIIEGDIAPELCGMTFAKLLRSCHRVGDDAVRIALLELRLTRTQSLGGLTAERRMEIAQYLRANMRRT